MATGEYVHACVTYTCFILQAYVFQMFITAFEKPRAAESRPWAGREDRADRRVCAGARGEKHARQELGTGRAGCEMLPLPSQFLYECVGMGVCTRSCVYHPSIHAEVRGQHVRTNSLFRHEALGD